MSDQFTVITPSSFTRLTTIDAARDECGLTDSDSDHMLFRLIDRASALIASYLGRPLGVTTAEEVFWAPIDRRYTLHDFAYTQTEPRPKILRLSPVNSVVSVIENGTTLIAGDDYIVDAGLLTRVASTVQGDWYRDVVVRYTAGWFLPEEASPTLPGDIEAACLALIRSGWFGRTRDPSIIMETTEGVGSVRYQGGGGIGGSPWLGLDSSLKEALSPYVVRVG